MATKTAVLCCDLQNGILPFLDEKDQTEIFSKAQKTLTASRSKGFLVVYIRVVFRPNYPEINPNNQVFAAVKNTGKFIEGSKETEIHPSIAPQEGDIVVTKVRFGSFSTTNLRTILDAQGINHIVLFGISTSGVILTTVREAADLDYKITVLSDACKDQNSEVHNVLMKHVFPRQATVQTVDEWLAQL